MKRLFPFQVSALRYSFMILVLSSLLPSLPYLPIASKAQASVATAISPTDGTGSPASLGTIITSGTSTIPTDLCTASCVITGGTRAGNNIFHSLGDLNIGALDSARFQTGLVNPLPDASVSNILARITGGPSNLLGNLNSATYYPSANLFLMNPAGFLFGPNTTVNVGGMVTFTSADYLRLRELGGNNTGIFHADLAQTSLLTSAPVAAFGFLGSNPGAITIQGSQFTVTEGTGITLVGGNITVQSGTLDSGTIQPARLVAPGGQISLASVASPGEVSAVDFMPASDMPMGNITLSQGTLLNVSADTAGTVRIRGGQFLMDNATISADTVNTNGALTAVDIQLAGNFSMTADTNPAITAKTSGSGDTGEVLIAAVKMEVMSSPTDIITVIDTHTSGSGRAGNVGITTTGDLNVTGGEFPARVFFIDSGTIGPDGGQGGDVTIAAQNVNLQHASINTGDFIANIIGEDAAGSGGNLTITADTIQLTDSFVVTDGFIGGNGGNLTLTARDIEIHSFSSLSASGFANGGAIRIIADQLTVDNSQFEVDNAGGPSEGIMITGGAVELKNGSTIASQTFGDHAAGDIHVTATDHLTLADDLTTDGALSRPTGLYTNSIGIGGTLGTAGAITVTTPLLQLINGARIDSTSRTSGNAGAVTITANSILVSGERPFDPFGETQFFLGGRDLVSSGIYARTVGSRFCSGLCGNAGNISIATGSLGLENGGVINSGTTNGGRGGDITIRASDTITIAGSREDGTPGEVFSRTTGSGNGGTISITSPSVSLNNRAEISADTTGAGTGGSINIRAGSTFASNASTVSSTATQAAGGDIKITAGQSVTLNNGSSISASSTGPGDAGNIVINAGQSFLATNSSVTTRATAPDTDASGGNITVNAANMVHLTNSQLNASVHGSSRTVGGNITIDPQYVILQNSQILAQAIQGQGGAISINITSGGLFLPDATSTVNASSQFGVNGTVTIQSPNAPISGQIQPLGKTPLIATSLLNQHCAALAGGKFSSFTVTGRDSLPTEPGSWLTSPLAMLSAGMGEGLSSLSGLSGVVRAGLAAHQKDQTVLSLRQITPAGFLTQAFAVDRSAGCRS